MQTDIFNYLNYREYLKDFYQQKKQTQSRYSYAVFSLRAGIKSPNYLKLVLDGARNITNDNILRFAKALNLTELETVYWENLVAFNQAKTQDQRRHYFVKLTHSPLPTDQDAGRSIREIRDEWDYYSAWYHASIRELVLLEDFSEDPVAVAQMMRDRITPAQAEESLKLLVRLGFLVRNEKGKLVQAERQVRYFSEGDLRNLAIQRFHRSTGELALDSIENDPVLERDFSGLTIAVTKAELPKLKAKITEFRQALNLEFSKSDTADQVFQINFQVIPVSKGEKK